MPCLNEARLFAVVRHLCRGTRSVASGALLLILGLPLLAQEGMVSISVQPIGAPYQVDGTLYYAPTTFVWPKGSKHTLELVSYCVNSPVIPVPDICQTRYIPGGWTINDRAIDAPLQSPIAIVTADPRITKIEGSSDVEHRVYVSFFDANGGTGSEVNFPATKCIGPKPTAGGPGIACVGGRCFRESAELWLTPGTYPLEAIPYDGSVFTGWYTGGFPGPFVSTYTVTGPAVLNPRFAPAKRVQIMTDPPELRVLVDRTEVITSFPPNYVPTCSAPGFFDFAEGSTHVLGAPSPQVDLSGKEWVFDSWSNGGGQDMIYKADRANVPEILVAKFVPGIRVSLLVPPGLKLIVDGRDTWPSYNFIWGAGTKHIISAPSTQTDRDGRQYVFKGWSNGGPPSQEIVLDTENLGGIRLTAEYAVLGMVKVQSNLPVDVQVGDNSCSTPCTFHREIGSELTVTAPQSVSLSEDSRLDLVSMGSERSNVSTVKLGIEPTTLSLNYRVSYKIAAAAHPTKGADIRMDPPSPDAFYPANARVQVYSVSRPGYKFRRWDGDITDRFSPAVVTVNGPLRVTAVLEPVPEISPAGVQNAAGDTPVHAVAPGSIISIYGGSLAPSSEAGPSTPLRQTLAGVTVHVAGHILPLFFVSPEQINAQLPFDLPEGMHTLTIRNRDMPEATASFQVVRNAPGLFTSLQSGLHVATLSRVAGPPISADNPVRSGDLVTVFGTGFGPHRIPPPEGFYVQESDAFRLLDNVDVVIGNTVITPEYAGAATGLPGTVAIRFRIPADLAQDAVTHLAFRVNGTLTNQAVLPTAHFFSGNTAPETLP